MMAEVKCRDCREPLQRISYVRRLRPGELRDIGRLRDPLCHSCWQADDSMVEAARKAKELEDA